MERMRKSATFIGLVTWGRGWGDYGTPVYGVSQDSSSNIWYVKMGKRNNVRMGNSRFFSLSSDTYVSTICIYNLTIGSRRMSKQDLIECIREINRGARHDFLDQFSEQELDMYLEHLMEVDLEEMALSA
jgi:hypothetical protein